MPPERDRAWQPVPLADVVHLLGRLGRRWWVSGGLALELYTGRSWRPHTDTDIGVLRRDARHLADVLDGWDIRVPGPGRPRPWHGEPLRAERQENALWCRPTPNEPWQLDVSLNDGDDAAWAYRRDPTLRLPWSEAVLVARDTIPFLTPDVQLLFKSVGTRAKDHHDASEVVPALSRPMTSRLRSQLPAGHPWHHLIARR